MIACIYGTGAAAFVEPTIQELARAAAKENISLVGVRVERLLDSVPESLADARILYVLPLEVPIDEESAAPVELSDLLTRAFPKARVANSITGHDLCSDRIELNERLIERGIPVPETLVTSSPDEAREFIRQFEHAVLRDPRPRGHASGFVVFRDDSGSVVGEVRDKRYVVELVESGIGRNLQHGILSYPPPYFLQRMVTRVGRRGVLIPAQVLRAYVIEDQIPFWTETYRDRVRRPSDFLLTSGSGAPLRFVQVVSAEAEKLALRATKATGCTIAAVDIIRSDTGYVVLDVIADGRHLMIDRSFKSLPEFREAFDLDMHIASDLVERLR